jgi:hypothetical protein
LHNLILQIEGGTFDAEFREELCEQGQEGFQPPPDVDSDFEDPVENGDLRQACRALKTDGTRFRKVVMKRLFNSPYSTATHRPIPVADRAQVRGRPRRRGGHGGRRQ